MLGKVPVFFLSDLQTSEVPLYEMKTMEKSFLLENFLKGEQNQDC